MLTIMDKIKVFETSVDETVGRFNQIFTVPLVGFDPAEVVTIGEPCSPETRRELTVGNKTFAYDFKLSGEELNG